MSYVTFIDEVDEIILTVRGSAQLLESLSTSPAASDEPLNSALSLLSRNLYSAADTLEVDLRSLEKSHTKGGNTDPATY